MDQITIRNYLPADSFSIMGLQLVYQQTYPEAKVVPAEVYHSHPSFDNGNNLFCAFNESNQLIGYASIFPSLLPEDSPIEDPHLLWLTIKINPQLDKELILKDLLYEKILVRVQEITATVSKRKIQLGVCYFASETSILNYFKSKGFQNNESVYQLIRNLTEPITESSIPVGITIQQSKMDSLEEQLQYIQAGNLAFPDTPKSLAELEFFLQSPDWEEVMAISALDQNRKIIGSIMVYWDKAENLRNEEKIGATEEVFVVPEWRGRGIAKYLIKEGLTYLKEHGIKAAILEVFSHNEEALTLFKTMGFQIMKEEIILESNFESDQLFSK